MMSHIIDCMGLKCPQPVIQTKKYFDSIESGDATIVVDNEVSKNNVIKYAGSSGYQTKVDRKDGTYLITIKKVHESNDIPDIEEKRLTILVSSNVLGSGDDNLGAALMKSYFYALAEGDIVPKDLLFLNSGVKLAVEGSDVLESLIKLEERGVNIASCGTCLDFYQLKDKLVIGEITNMYTIIEKMHLATNTIKL